MKEQRKKRTSRATLIYDGNCPVCGAAVKWIRENEKKGAFEMLPCQSDDVRRRFPDITEQVCMKSVQLVLQDGTVLAGEKALPEIFNRLRRYGPTAALFKLPGAETVSRALYRWFADKRYHIAALFSPNKKK